MNLSVLGSHADLNRVLCIYLTGPSSYPQPGQVIIGYQMCEPKVSLKTLIVTANL